MAFVNEEIVEEKDKELLASFNLKNPITNELRKANRWTIDRENLIFFMGLGGQGFYQGEIPEFFSLIWDNKEISIEAYSKGQGDRFSGVEIWWKITNIQVPESLRDNNAILIDTIKDAFTIYGRFHRNDYIKRVNFEYIAKPVFYKEVAK